MLRAAGSVPPGVLQPGDVSAATQVRAGLLNAEVPPSSDAAALWIRRTVDDLGPADLWELARGTALTREELAWGAAVTLARQDAVRGSPVRQSSVRQSSVRRDILDELAARTLVDEIAERAPRRWGRDHADAVRTVLYRILADLADVLLEVSESTPTPLEWTGDDTGGMRASAVLGGVSHGVLVLRAMGSLPAAEPVWPHPSLPAERTAWRWRIASGPADRAVHECGSFPAALAARHAAECAITALAAGRCHL
ncbi:MULTISPECIES: hypothetical protein [Streptomyces]|uniref:Uncharacterized protein n=1 Tax=Streptomyces demainii TaxID=588122 RepID=A0ABT9KPC5_9ACTN|nr:MULTISPECIES: hypothetical protein [Streptomyces]MDP9610288.1 hypothetical protein [Streptomyces demainii]